MNRSVENLLRPLRARVGRRYANAWKDWIKPCRPECATADDEGPSKAQRAFHKVPFRLSRCSFEATTEEYGLVNDKGLRLNTVTGDEIDLYLIGRRTRGFGRRAQPGQRSNQRVASPYVS
jgi:hypothetical protein